MKMMNLKVTVALIMAASFAHADVFTWSGGGADNGWLTDQNWSSGLAPADNGTASLTFSGSTRLSPDNDFVADTVFAAIRFSNNGSTGKKSAFSLSGNRLTLGGDITTIESSAAITDTAALDMTLSASRTITANKLHHLTITGNISESGGPQGLIKAGAGNLTLQGTNTYSGKTTVSGGSLYFNSIGNINGGASALGAPTTLADGTIDAGATLIYQGDAITSDRPICLIGSPLTLRNNGPGALTLTGDIFSDSASTARALSIRGNEDIILTGLVDIGAGGLSRTDNGTLVLACPTNSFSGALTIYKGCISVETISDSGLPSAIGQGNRINFGQVGWENIGILRFGGTAGGSCNRSMAVSSSYSTAGGRIENTVAGQLLTMSGNLTDNGPLPPSFWLAGVGDGEMSGIIQGGIKIIKIDSGTWTLSGANTTTGAVSVEDGTLLINGSTTSGSAISVNDSAALGGTGTVHGVVALANGATLSPGVDGVGTLTLDNGGSDNLTLNNSTIACDLSSIANVCDRIDVSGELVLNGVNTIAVNLPPGPTPFGVYTVMTYASKSGVGTLVVDQEHPDILVTVGATNVTLTVADISTAIWQGDGIANLWDKTAPNWTTGMYSENNRVVFDDIGSATPPINITPDAVGPFSVTVDSDTNNYTIGGAAITGTSGLTKSGASLLTLTGNNTYNGMTEVKQGKLVLEGGSLSNSSVHVGLDATFTEDADSVIAGSDVNFISLGSATLAGSNTYDGVTIIGAAGTSNIWLTIRNDKALGSAAGGVTLYGGGNRPTIDNQLRMDVDGIVVKDETLTLVGESSHRASLYYTPSSGSATWDGDIILGGADAYLDALSGGGTLIVGGSSQTTITGTTGSFTLRGWGGIVLNSTVNIGTLTFSRNDGGTALINSTNNIWGRSSIAQGTFKLGATDALPVTTTLSLGKGTPVTDAVFDLNGKSQRIAALQDVLNTSVEGGTQRILGIALSTLIVSNDAANTFGVVGSSIEGEVTLVKSGVGTLTLTSTNTTAGSFIVSNGTLAVSSTGSFGNNSTNVVVAGGTLSLQSSVSIADTATLSIADGATLELDAGVNESVAYLFIDGAPKRATTYGATGSGAIVTDDLHFSGSGVLTVLRDTSGTIITLR